MDIGVPAGYAQLKQAQLTAMAAGKLPVQSVVRATKTGAGAAQSTTSAGPMVATCNGTYPCVLSLPFPGFHQKTQYYCLVAFVQSVAFWDLSNSYMTMATGTIRGAQDKIYGTNLSNGIRAFFPDDAELGHIGANDYKALAWINGQFSSHSGYTFRYVAVKPIDVSSFMWYVRYDVDLYAEVNYVRVDLSTYAYRWGQSVDKHGNHPLHATAASGYDDNAGTVISYDPFAYGPNRVGGSCTSASYSNVADWGCVWTITQVNYFRAMDRSASLNDATASVWY